MNICAYPGVESAIRFQLYITSSQSSYTLIAAGVKISKVLLRSESPSGKRAKLRTVAASNTKDHASQSLYYCLFTPLIYIVVLRAHPVRGESYIQRNTTGKVATVP